MSVLTYIKNQHILALKTTQVKQLRIQVSARREPIREFLETIPKPFCIALEATRNWYWVYDLLEDMAKEVKLAHPIKTPLIAEAKIKTDKIDASILADLLRTNYLPTCFVPNKGIRQTRELLRHRAYLIRIRSGLKTRIHCLLDKLGIEHPFEDLFTKTGLEFLKNLKLPFAYQRELNDDLELLEFLNKKEKQQNRLIEQLCKKSKEVSLLMSLPGFGYHNSLLVSSEIANPQRFPDGEHYASYCGLVTSVHITDKTVYYGHITKQENHRLRWVYIEAAHFARRYSVRFGNLYNRVKERSGHQKAIVAVARELAVVSYYILKYQRPFDDNYQRNREAFSG